MSQHRVSDLATPDPSPITSLSNPQKHTLYTLIASAIKDVGGESPCNELQLVEAKLKELFHG